MKFWSVLATIIKCTKKKENLRKSEKIYGILDAARKFLVVSGEGVQQLLREAFSFSQIPEKVGNGREGVTIILFSQ